jgi:hypothetical protein
MEAIIILAIVAAIALSVGLIANAKAKHTREPNRYQRWLADRTASAIRRRRQTHADLNRLAAEVQRALLNLEHAQDFQRAACWARHAKNVPATFRHRIFQRFRPKLVDHMATRLATGQDESRLIASLTDLVQALGIASFEAQYIVSEARTRVSTASSSDDSFNAQLRSLHREHDQRMRALRGMNGVDADTKEQLLETEQSRFREAVIRLGGGETVSAPGVDQL